MSSVWTSRAIANLDPTIRPDPQDLHKFVVLLLHGKNSFGDRIYAYVKITIGSLEKLRDSLVKGGSFMPSDFGEVIAAGRGEPTTEVKAEIAEFYKIIDNSHTPPPPPVAVPQEKKAWDEY